MAQSVEQFTRNEQVAGSNPAGSSIMNICRCVGTGRRDGLKIRCQRWRVGSSPTTGTNKKSTCVNKCFFYSISRWWDSNTEGAIFERVQWTKQRKCCVTAVKNFKEKAVATAEIFGYRKRAEGVKHLCSLGCKRFCFMV